MTFFSSSVIPVILAKKAVKKTREVELFVTTFLCNSKRLLISNS